MRMEAWVPKRTIRRYGAKQVYYRPTSIDQNQLILACESMTDAFSAVDSEWRYTYINAAMEQLIGYRREDVLGKVCWDLFPSLIGTSFYDNCHKATQSGQVTVFEEKSLKSDLWLEYRLFPAGGGLAGYVRDVTDRKRNEEQIARISYRDTLTGLPNRTLFQDRLEQALMAARRTDTTIALLFLDLNRFKEINDSLGHSVGDKVLQEAAARMTTCLGPENTLARMGGDEFMALLPNCPHADDATQVAQRILDAFSDPFVAEEHEFFLTASIGISVFPHDGEDATSLLQHADMAMYQAKTHGHNSFRHYSEAMNTTASERLFLAASLRRAIDRNELFLLYQPQASTDAWSTEGPQYKHVEALVRWRHPELGVIPPVHFITLAEEAGLIGPLGRWVLREACRQGEVWRAAGEPITVAVNISARQLDDPGFVGSVEQALADTGLPPDLLQLELTESVLMHDRVDIIMALRRLRAMGVQLAVDDFGTGYSSLAYLRRFPLNTLKIDKMFIAESDQDEAGLAIVKSLIDLAHALGLDVVAEGVETPEQLRHLIHLGCDRLQGFLLYRPIEPSAVSELLRLDRQ